MDKALRQWGNSEVSKVIEDKGLGSISFSGAHLGRMTWKRLSTPHSRTSVHEFVFSFYWYLCFFRDGKSLDEGVQDEALID